MQYESCNGWESEHKDRILSKNSPDLLETYPRNIRFQCHRCDTISTLQVVYYLMRRITTLTPSSILNQALN
nr:MAG TPA: hypothetical protein [Caudoviricetes sp.]